MDQWIIDGYWRRFLQLQKPGHEYPSETPEAWHFCDNEKDADALVKLVLAGIKQGTAALVDSYLFDGEDLPVAGECSIITDWAGEPMCIIEAIAVHRLPFRDISPELAAIEGEGDGSLKHWRRVHMEAFSRELESRGEQFSEEREVLFQEFRLVHR